MPRNPLGAFLFYPAGLVLAGGGAIAAGWVALAVYDKQQAYEAAVWALRRSPIRFDTPAESIARDLIQPGLRIWQAAIAAFLAFVGWDMLRGGRTAMRPASASDDGKFSLALKTAQPRLGENLDGRIAIEGPPPVASEMYRVELRCTRRYTLGGHEKHQVMFADYREVMAAQDSRGWGLPFSFAIPANVPASLEWVSSQIDAYQWRLGVFRMDALITTESWFDLQVLDVEQEVQSPRSDR